MISTFHSISFRVFPSLVFAFALAFSSPVLCQSGDPEITAPELRRHVQYLAGDQLEGRFMGSAGNLLAAEHMAREFERYGLKPAGENSTWYQYFDVVTGMEISGKNEARVRVGKKSLGLASGKDFTPYGLSLSETVSGELVFAGYGLVADKAKYNDYARLQIKGKVAVILSGYPSLPEGSEQLMESASLRAKALAARERGAVALLVVHPSQSDAAKLRYDGSASHAGIVAMSLSHRGFAKLLGIDATRIKDLLTRYEESRDSTLFHFSGSTATLTASVAPIRKRIPNVVGMVEGSDPVLKDKFIVLGAHFDHLGTQHESSLNKSGKLEIHNGADDNASGVAGVLELAQYFVTHRPRYSLVFMGFNAEESGLLGSSHWTKSPTLPMSQILAMLNLDMIGRLDSLTKRLNIQGTGTSANWESLIKQCNTSHGFDLALIKDGRGSSDHSSFNSKSIPVLFFFTGLHTDYHRPSDDIEKLNFPGEERVVRFVADIVKGLDSSSVPPAYVVVSSGNEPRMRSFNVYVGTIPDYGATEQGFKISGTSPGSPAEKAGMKQNDVIIQFGDTKVLSIYDYMNALAKHKPGEDVSVKVLREGKEQVLSVHLEKK